MNNRLIFKAFGLPVLIIILIVIVYSKLSGTENVKYIHIVTLLALGMAIGILVRNIVAYFFRKL